MWLRRVQMSGIISRRSLSIGASSKSLTKRASSRNSTKSEQRESGVKIDLKTGLFFALCCVAFQSDVYAQGTLERINAIYASIAGDHAGLYVAQEMGLFRKHGLEVNLSYTAGAAQVIQTMMAGENQ